MPVFLTAEIVVKVNSKNAEAALKTISKIAKKTFDDAEKNSNNFNKSLRDGLAKSAKSFRTVTDNLDQFGKKLLKTGAAITATLAAGFKFTGDFERSMRQATAVTANLLTEDLETMTKMSEDASIRLNIAATETAKAFYYLGSAGLSAKEQIGTFNTALSFAKAGVMDVGDSTEILLSIMKGFNLTSKDAAGIADVLSMGFTTSLTTLREMGEAMSFVSTVADITNTTLGETVAIIGLMGDAGIRGSRAGTALRRTFINLMDPKKELIDLFRKYNIEIYNTDKNLRGFSDILKDIDKGLAKATPEAKNFFFATLAGDRALTGMLKVVRNGGKDYEAFVERLKKAGGTMDKIVDWQMSNLIDQLGVLGRSFQNLGRHIFASGSKKLLEFSENFKAIAEGTTAFVDKNKELIASLLEFTAKTALVAVGIGVLTLAISSLIKVLTVAAIVFNVALSPITLTIVAITAGIYGLRSWIDWAFEVDSLELFIDKLKEISTWFSKWHKPLEFGFEDTDPAYPGGPTKSLDIKFLEGAAPAFVEPPAPTPTGIEVLKRNIKKDVEFVKNLINKSISGLIPDFKDTDLNAKIKELFADIEKAKIKQIEETSKQIEEDIKIAEKVSVTRKDYELSSKEMRELLIPLKEELNLRKELERTGVETLALQNEILGLEANILREGKSGSILNLIDEWEVYQQQINKINNNSILSGLKNAISGVESASSDFFASWMDGTKTMGEAFDDLMGDISKVFAKMISDLISRWIIFQAVTGIAGLVGVNPGVMAGTNPLANVQVAPTPAPAMARGGITRGLSFAGEAGPEAVVPLPDGRSIPVNMNRQETSTTIKIINESSQKVEGKQGDSYFDGGSLVTEVILKDFESNGPIRNNILNMRR